MVYNVMLNRQYGETNNIIIVVNFFFLLQMKCHDLLLMREKYENRLK